MPLRDHFHGSVDTFCPWPSFHGNWATKMVDRLNEARLPDRYTAQADRQLGVQAEADVATLERQGGVSLFTGSNGAGHGGVGTVPEVYAPPAPSLSGLASFAEPAPFEVKIYRGRGGWDLVAAVELVSEANKDRKDARRTFTVKCASYLQRGVSVVVVDVVTNRSGDLHNDLCDLLDLPAPVRWASPTGLHVAAYRPGKAGDPIRLDVWPLPSRSGNRSRLSRSGWRLT